MKITNRQAEAIAELKDRRHMAIKFFKAMEHQDPVFEQPRPKYMLITGGNRGGKSICMLSLLAAIALDEKITLSNGKQVDARMPWQKDRCLKIWIACIDLKHVGEVIFPGLFKSGLFKLCRDPVTRKYRTFIPDVDKRLGIKPRDAGPLIPGRFIKNIVWENKAASIFSQVTIIDPATKEEIATIHAYTSKGDPPQGRAVDFIAIDEQLENTGYIDELKARIIDLDGQIAWASWNDEESPELKKFVEIIDRESEKNSGIAKKVVLSMSANKTLTRKAIQDFRDGCATEEEWLQRDRGIPPSEKQRMYPRFDAMVHTAIVEADENEDEISRILRDHKGIPPNSWTKYLALDPGTKAPAILLAAVPPPELGKFLIPYQEIYPGRADPWELAEFAQRYTEGQEFYRFICDKRAGRQQTMGLHSGTRVIDAYFEAFERYGIRCSTTGHMFMFGSDDVAGRQAVVQGLLHAQPGEHFPRLRIVTERCEQLCTQLYRVKKRVIAKEEQDERKARGDHDLVDCYDAETEVLTKENGWVRFSGLVDQPIQELGTYNMETRQIEFQEPLAIFGRPHQGEMIQIKGKRLDLLVTPNHRMVVAQANGASFTLAKDLTSSLKIPTAPGAEDAAEIKTIDAVPYDGTVYCATVPNGTLVVRRNKKVAMCGNCLEYIAASHPRYVPQKKSSNLGSAAYQWYMKKFGKKNQRTSINIGTYY